MRRPGRAVIRRPEMSEEEGKLLADLVQELIGMSYDRERVRLLAGRLSSRVEKAGCDTYFDYYQRVKYERGSLADDLIDAVVNNETYFFREVAQLDAVADMAGARDRTRVLSAACSTGEEPYSLAMVLAERGLLDRVEIVAVDVSRAALARAEGGVYGQHSFRGVEGRYVDTHFSAEEHGLRLNDRYRQAVSFRRVNLLQPAQLAPLGTFDAVLCRNVLIYFDVPTKRRVVDGLLGRLAPGGVMFLGHSESLFGIRDEAPVQRVSGCIGYRAPDEAPSPAFAPLGAGEPVRREVCALEATNE